MAMRIRPYGGEGDFAALRSWIADERAHAMWCANRFPWPLEERGFAAVLAASAERGDRAFIAEDEDGRPVGFFCCGMDTAANEGVLMFVVVASGLRGRGYGRRMVALAARSVFSTTEADAVRLSVFPENAGAKRCYLAAGFTERSTVERAFRFHDEEWGRCVMVLQRTREGPANA